MGTQLDNTGVKSDQLFDDRIVLVSFSEMEETLQPSYTNVSEHTETQGFIVLTGNRDNHTMNFKGTSLSATTSSRLVSIVCIC